MRGAAHAAVLEGGVAETVVGRALVGVFEDLVGLIQFLETMLGVLVAGIAIRVPLHRLLAKGDLDVAVARRAFNRKRRRVAALERHSPPDDVASFRPYARRGRRRRRQPAAGPIAYTQPRRASWRIAPAHSSSP